MSRKRKTRPDPQRPGYERSYSTSFRDSDSWDWPGRDSGAEGEPAADASGNGSSGGDPNSWTDAIGDGVRMGYRVIEEQIRQGQRVAEQINDRFYQAGPGGLGAPDLTQRMWRSYWDLAAMWWDFMGSMTGGQGLRPQPPAWGNGEQPGDFHADASAPELAIEVDSKRATRVGLILDGLHGCRSLVALKLRASDDSELAGEVRFGPLVADRPLVVEISLPADQQPGTYVGKVVDGTTGEYRGRLTVQIE